MKKTITSRHNIQQGMICGFFDKEVFRIGLTLSVTDATCRIAVHDTESLTLPQSRVVLGSETLYPTAEPKSVIDEFYRKIHIFNAEKHLPLIRENLLPKSSPVSLTEAQKLGNLPDDDVCRFALYMALRTKPGWFRFKKGLYLALTLAEEQEYYQSEEQKQLHKRDMETCPLLARKGIPVLFTDAILQEAEAVSEYTAAQERTDLSGLECWTIDSEKTQDLDDAISLQKKDKSWELGIHISDVSSFIAIGSNLDAEALRRSASVYLPSMDIHMLPPAVSCQKASLVQLQLRPALSVLCTVDNEGQLISSRIILSQIRVSKNLCYEEVETLLSTQATEESKPLQEKLITLQSIVNRHLQARIDKGAVTVENQEMTAARRMVAECMVIYNSILAAFTAQTAIPVFYRHPAVYEDIKAEDNMLFIPAVLGTEPRPHLAMGLDVYAQFSSPLRRYSDLINQRQVIALLTDAEPPYAKARLDEMLEHLVTNQKRIRQITLMAEKESQES